MLLLPPRLDDIRTPREGHHEYDDPWMLILYPILLIILDLFIGSLSVLLRMIVAFDLFAKVERLFWLHSMYGLIYEQEGIFSLLLVFLFAYIGIVWVTCTLQDWREKSLYTRVLDVLD